MAFLPGKEGSTQTRVRNIAGESRILMDVAWIRRGPGAWRMSLASPTKGQNSMKSRAFTLIELLVVIAIIAVLMAILMPSLKLAKDQAQRVHCVSNTKTLALGWFMYKDENDGRIVGGSSFVINDEVSKKPIPPWVAGQSASQGASGWDQQMEEIEDGALFPYVKNVKCYRCPADRRKESASGRMAAFRTFSIAGGANGERWGTYDVIKLYTELKNPAERYIFVEEMDTRGNNLGSWQMHPRKTGSTWVDPVAMWHNKKSTLGFADGHAEMHDWKDQSFIEWNLKAMNEPSTFTFAMTPPADEQDDITYMAHGFPYRNLK